MCPVCERRVHRTDAFSRRVHCAECGTWLKRTWATWLNSIGITVAAGVVIAVASWINGGSAISRVAGSFFAGFAIVGTWMFTTTYKVIPPDNICLHCGTNTKKHEARGQSNCPKCGADLPIREQSL